MTLVTPLAIFMLGATIASFVGVVAARLNTGQGFLTGRSQCDACGAALAPRSLVPVFSYFASHARARCCGVRLSPGGPLSEVLLGGLFVLAYASLGFSAALPFFLLSLALLLLLVLYDFTHQILPPRPLAAFVAASALAGFLAAPALSDFFVTLLVASLVAASLAAIHFLSRGRAMGLADAPLVFGLALLVGSAAFPGFIFSFWIGAVIGIALLARRPVGSRMGVEVPFAPFLAAGFLLAYFTQWNPFTFAATLFR